MSFEEEDELNSESETYNCTFYELTPKKLKKICESLSNKNNFKNIIFKKNDFSSKSCIHISNLIENNKFIKTLEIGFNDIGEKGIKHISEALKTNQTLKTIKLYETNFKDKGLEYLSKSIEINNTLIEIDITENYFTSKGIEKFHESLQKNTTLQILILSSNKIGELEMNIISKILECNPSIKRLDLSKNLIRDSDLQKLSESLLKNFTLTNLNLSDNEKLTSKGLFYLQESFDENPTLKELFYHKRISFDDSTKEFFKRNSNLINLEIGFNECLDEFLIRFFDIIKENFVLKSLDVTISNFLYCKSSTIDYLIVCLKSNPTLRIFKINSIERKYTEEINKRLGENLRIWQQKNHFSMMTKLRYEKKISNIFFCFNE